MEFKLWLSLSDSWVEETDFDIDNMEDTFKSEQSTSEEIHYSLDTSKENKKF